MWARGLLGAHAFLLAVLRHGLFEFSDLKKYAELLAAESREDDGSGKQLVRNKGLRREALRARQALREAKKFRNWQEDGWQLTRWQQSQLVQLDLGNLEKRMKEANAAYGHGVGADMGITKEQAMTLQIFTENQLGNYFAQ